MTYLSRLDILNAQDFNTKEVEVEEWGGTVLVRELSAKEHDEIGLQAATPDGNIDVRLTRGMRVKMVHWCCIDEKGLPIFEKGDVQKLERKSSAAVGKVARVIMELSGLTTSEEDEEGEPKNE